MTYDPIDTSATDNAADGSVTADTLDSTTVDNSGTATTQDLVVNGTATGPFGGAPVLEAGDSITVAIIDNSTVNQSFQVLYDGIARDVLGGIVEGGNNVDFEYTFSDGSTIQKNGSNGVYDTGNRSRYSDANAAESETDILPPAKNVKRIEVGTNIFSNHALGAEVILKD